jgi:hypothetical protein
MSWGSMQAPGWLEAPAAALLQARSGHEQRLLPASARAHFGGCPPHIDSLRSHMSQLAK